MNNQKGVHRFFVTYPDGFCLLVERPCMKIETLLLFTGYDNTYYDGFIYIQSYLFQVANSLEYIKNLCYSSRKEEAGVL